MHLFDSKWGNEIDVKSVPIAFQASPTYTCAWAHLRIQRYLIRLFALNSFFWKWQNNRSPSFNIKVKVAEKIYYYYDSAFFSKKFTSESQTTLSHVYKLATRTDTRAVLKKKRQNVLQVIVRQWLISNIFMTIPQMSTTASVVKVISKTLKLKNHHYDKTTFTFLSQLCKTIFKFNMWIFPKKWLKLLCNKFITFQWDQEDIWVERV